MNYSEIRRIAMMQSAIDLNCRYEYFTQQENKVVISKLIKGHRRDFTQPHFCQFVCYGNALVASVDSRIEEYMVSFVGKYPGFRCCEKFKELTHEFDKYGKRIGLQNFFLPDNNFNREVHPGFDVEILVNDDIKKFYSDDRFHMALCYEGDSERQDVLAVAGYKNNELIGIAGASNDSDTMWQVGIDVIPTYRNNGVATVLVKIITDEILKRGIVPFYGTAWANIASRNVAINSGYKPTWVELSAW
jgi:RimJ/RimL family protein N-acetyltransferase